MLFRSGHSHSDSLSLVVSAGGRPILTDSGTYTYVGDAQLRNRFRGSIAHNTIRVDGRDQAVPMGPFWWSEPPAVSILSWHSSESQDEIVGECRYAGVTHRRCVRLVKPHWIFILDRVDGLAGEHDVEQFWHLAHSEARAYLHLGPGAEEFECQHSYTFGVKEPACCVAVRRKTSLPTLFAAAVSLIPGATVKIIERTDGAVFAPAHPYHLEAPVAMVL